MQPNQSTGTAPPKSHTMLTPDITKSGISWEEMGILSQMLNIPECDYVTPEQLARYSSDSPATVRKLLDEKSERLFHTTLTIRYYAETPKKLKTLQDKLIRVTQKNGGRLLKLDFMQEEAIGSSLPLGVNKVPIDRCLTTSAIAGFMPFTTDELFVSPKSTYYGLNQRTRNMIMASRLLLDNPNGIFLGIPGKGKSFSAKREIFDVFLRRPDDDIFINDPEGEYAPLVDLLHGQVIKALTAERKSLTEKIKDAENAQLVEMIRNAAPGGEPSDLAQDFAAFMREREAQSEQTGEAAASGVSA